MKIHEKSYWVNCAENKHIRKLCLNFFNPYENNV